MRKMPENAPNPRTWSKILLGQGFASAQHVCLTQRAAVMSSTTAASCAVYAQGGKASALVSSKLSRSAGGSPREESRRASEARAACVDALARKIALSSVYGPGLAMALSSSWLAHLAHVVQRPPLQAVNRLYAQAVSRLYAQSGVVRARMSQRGRGDASCAARSDLQQSISIFLSVQEVGTPACILCSTKLRCLLPSALACSTHAKIAHCPAGKGARRGGPP